ncbi:hypothetical protein PV328_008736 [Microctonus aethiopoides]|uniref:SANTA domain-containing protein n=1 Tax=Microctonus aethiopoides TaxID=144406 RepID=A0AA39FK78_9HYME|nr:hypothetical protein PV328_008736 [Microctonus aethiopoides]
MTSESENTFGNIQMNERYKRLKRNLKLTLIKGEEKRSADNLTSFNTSSISKDNLDISCGTYSVYSKNGSEVVSSSFNMRNVFSYQNQKKFPDNNCNINKNDNITTSTVKSGEYPLTNDVALRSLMPPPKSIGILAHSSRNSSLGAASSPMNTRLTMSGIRQTNEIASPSVISSIECPSSTNTQNTSRIIFDKETENNNVNKNFPLRDKPDRIFSKWRVMLNDKGKLIIKGTLECGKVARSKPVIRRISAISVQSIFNHIYNLNGNIYDERNELPDYVRCKFFNGFPDDWENVYQLWRNYVAHGSSINFRWPTPITDSDDEIKSGITEETLPRIIERRPRLRSDSLRNHADTNIPERSPSTINQAVPNENIPSCNQCRCSTAGSINNESTKSSKSKLQTNDNKYDDTINVAFTDKTQRQESSTSSATNFPHSEEFNSISLKDVLKEDKIKIILENMNSKNCTIEYIDKVFQMYDCFKYIFSYRPELKNETESFKSSRITADEKCSNHDFVSKKNSDTTFTKSDDARANIVCSSTEHTVGTHKDSLNDHRITSKKIANGSSDRNYKRRIHGRLMRNKYNDSKSYDNDSDYDEPLRSSRRILRSHIKRKTYRRSSIVKEKSRHQIVKSTSDDSEDNDHVPKITNSSTIPVGSNQKGNIKTSPKSIQINGNTNCHRILRDIATITKCDLQQLHQENMKRTPSQRLNRAGSMSTIGGFLKNYDSCESVTEEENQVYNVKQKPLIPNINYEKSKIDEKTHLRDQFNSQNKYTNYDSSVSFTEDEYVKVNREMRNEGQVLQGVDHLQHLQQTEKTIKSKTNQSSSTSQMHERKNFVQSLINIPEVDEKFQVTSERAQKKSSPDKYKNDKIILNDDKENRLINDDENQNEINQSFINCRELEMNDEIVKVQAERKLDSAEKKMKPAIIRLEKASIDIKLFKGAQSQKLPMPHIELPKENVDPSMAIELLHSSKSLNDRKRVENPSSVLSTPVAQSKSMSNLNEFKTGEIHVNNDRTRNKRFNNVKDDKVSSERGVYGSENNPKRLTAWVPRVLHKSDTDYGLIFEGKLLNEADHILQRKFSTDFIHKRISLKIIKTESNEFFELVGDLTDIKHSMPKELQKLCFNGCPSKISQFCQKWKKLLSDCENPSEELMNESKNIQDMPMSSRGRRILPPLCYWAGERVALKDNQTVYSPGNSLSSSRLCTDTLPMQYESSDTFKSGVTKTKNTPILKKINSAADVQIKDKNSDGNKEKEENIELNIVEQQLPTLRSRIARATRKNQVETATQQTESSKRQLTRQLNENLTDSDHNYLPPTSKKRRQKINNPEINIKNEMRKLESQRKQASKISAPTTAHSIDTDVEKNRKYISSINAKNNEESKTQILKNNAYDTITYVLKQSFNRDCELSDDPVTDF